MGRSVVCLLVLGCFSPAASSAQVDVEAAAWLAGCWVAEAGDARADEVWMQPSGGMMVGMSRSVRGGVAHGYELVVLRRKDDLLTYTAFPSGQSPTDFGFVHASASKLRFENPEHDFPRAIEYVQAAPDSLIAHVFGDHTTTEPSFSLRYEKVVC